MRLPGGMTVRQPGGVLIESISVRYVDYVKKRDFIGEERSAGGEVRDAGEMNRAGIRKSNKMLELMVGAE
jgi:hypothetical protein